MQKNFDKRRDVVFNKQNKDELVWDTALVARMDRVLIAKSLHEKLKETGQALAP